MTIVVPNESEKSLLDKMIKESSEDYLIRLFKNNIAPDSDTVLTDFTEADFTGYTEITLLRADWDDAITVDKKGETNHATVSWVCSGDCNEIYGDYIVGKDSGDLLWCERFASSRNLDVGDTLNIDPKMTLKEV